MRGNVETIKLTAGLSVILAVITYIITVKENLGIQEYKWFTNSFLLTTFGGAFASMLVVLECEISRYFQNLESVESYLFSHLYYLYGLLQVISKNIDFQIKQKDTISKDFLAQLIVQAEAEMNAVYFTEYAPFRKNNGILATKKRYNDEVFPIVQQFLLDCRFLEIAVINDEICAKKSGLGVGNGMDTTTSGVLVKLSEQIHEPLMLLDEILIRIDKLCSGRYNWMKQRGDLIKRIPDNRIDMLEQFLQRE